MLDLKPALPIGVEPGSDPYNTGVLNYENFQLVKPLTLPNALSTIPFDTNVLTFVRGDESVNRFTLDELSYACAQLQLSVVPPSCKFQLTAKKADGSVVDPQVLTYSPQDLTNADGTVGFKTTQLDQPKFTDLHSVELKLLSGGLLASTINVLFDNVAATACLIG
ncbi:MAG: hypothetical protein L6R39_007622 [Caloplaca ligustica]|nr:MAG: hypothetical protein L6R39_007622 [Caloplaca ligustica]